MSKRSKATDIKSSVRSEVFLRDKYRCVSCGSPTNLTLAHIYINRSHGGLGVMQNLATLCMTCHHHLDNGKRNDHDIVEAKVKEYMMSLYGKPDFKALKYIKWLHDTFDE